MEDVIHAAELVGAKYSIPYHMVVNGDGFNVDVAEQFDEENRLILKIEEEIIFLKNNVILLYRT